MVPKRRAISKGLRSKGMTTRQNVVKAVAPSTLAASRTSSGMACRPARRTSITNGVHSQATMKVTLSRGNEENQDTAGKPTKCRAQSKMPVDGLRKRFFHNKAMTDGVTKKGTVARARTALLPGRGR